MAARRLTPAQFEALYRRALDPDEDSAQERTLASLCERDLLSYDHRRSLGQARPRYALRPGGWQEVHHHLFWLAEREDRGRSEFEHSLGCEPREAFASLVRARVRAAQDAMQAMFDAGED